MFYLIDEKDGLYGQKILFNADNLKSLEVTTGKNGFNLCFNFQNETQSFSFDPEKIPNVNQIIENIVQMSEQTYSNKFIVLKDIQNVRTISGRFGRNSHILDHATSILINIHEIGLVYEHEGEYVMTIDVKNFAIAESPEKVFHMIQSKTLENNKTNVSDIFSDNKIGLRQRL